MRDVPAISSAPQASHGARVVVSLTAPTAVAIVTYRSLRTVIDHSAGAQAKPLLLAGTHAVTSCLHQPCRPVRVVFNPASNYSTFLLMACLHRPAAGDDVAPQ